MTLHSFQILMGFDQGFSYVKASCTFSSNESRGFPFDPSGLLASTERCKTILDQGLSVAREVPGP